MEATFRNYVLTKPDRLQLRINDDDTTIHFNFRQKVKNVFRYVSDDRRSVVTFEISLGAAPERSISVDLFVESRRVQLSRLYLRMGENGWVYLKDCVDRKTMTAEPDLFALCYEHAIDDLIIAIPSKKVKIHGRFVRWNENTHDGTIISLVHYPPGKVKSVSPTVNVSLCKETMEVDKIDVRIKRKNYGADHGFIVKKSPFNDVESLDWCFERAVRKYEINTRVKKRIRDEIETKDDESMDVKIKCTAMRDLITYLEENLEDDEDEAWIFPALKDGWYQFMSYTEKHLPDVVPAYEKNLQKSYENWITFKTGEKSFDEKKCS